MKTNAAILWAVNEKWSVEEIELDPPRDGEVLVEFEAKSPSDRANSYFGLMEDLEELLGLPIDLIEPGPITNPYFRAEIERTRRPLYEAV